MKEDQLEKLLAKLSGEFFLFAPQFFGKETRIAEVESLADIDWSGKMPQNTWKEVFFPHFERLFDISQGKLVEIKTKYPPIACVGMNVLDLKALTLLEQVFSRDIYFQKRRQNTLLIGYSSGLPDDYKKYKVFSHEYEEKILEHLVFDVFITSSSFSPLAKGGVRGGSRRKFYSGSEKGQLILAKAGIDDYDHVEFAGAVAEKGPDAMMLKIKDKTEKSFKRPLWDKLDQICLACGKCSIACPTCFCFDFEDKVDPENQSRSRVWGNCFFNDFSKVAGGHRELDTVKKKIYFWYVHKFVRIPHEYSLPGCVSCGRCVKVCPVGIDIFKNIKEILGK